MTISLRDIVRAALLSAGVWVLPLFLCRLYATLGILQSLPVAMLRGLASDAVVGAAMGAMFSPLLLLRKRIPYFALWGLWSVLSVLNLEHTLVHQANGRLALASLALNKTFILGSVISLRVGLLALLIGGLAAACAYVLLRRGKEHYWKLSLALVVMAAPVAIPVGVDSPNWVQMSFVEENVRALVWPAHEASSPLDSDSSATDGFFALDLSGRPLVGSPAGRPNVLLILMESLGYGNLRPELMPRLNSYASKSTLVLSQFLAQQHQTNRGMYAALCGDYPNAVATEAKSDVAAVHGVERPCLPRLLSDGGYLTLYLQSASLRYMQKDLFARSAGFERIEGVESVHTASEASEWGVDDRSLFQHAGRRIRSLDPGAKPWFVTVLTSGSHHPYNVPGVARPSFDDAMRYADASLGEFMDALDADGFLDNTLVLITADEAGFADGEGLARDLEANHIPMLVFVPGMRSAPPVVQEGLFGLSDIETSITDYLGMKPALPGGGRSFFRRYSTPRDILFANVYLSRVYGVFGGRHLYACTPSFLCSAHEIGDKGLFGQDLKKGVVNDAHIDILRAVVERSDLTSERLGSEYVFRDADARYSGTRYLVADLKMSLRKGQKAIWNLRLSAEGPTELHAYIAEVFNADERGIILNAGKTISQGESVDFHYEFTAPFDLHSVWTKISVVADPRTSYTVADFHIKRPLPGATPPEDTTASSPGIIRDHPLIMHAMGGIGDATYTNSYEAFVANYKRGRRVFEFDLAYTSDGLLVASHGDGLALTHAEFMNSLADKDLTTLDAEGIVRLMAAYPDAFFVTDTKQEFTAVLEFLEMARKADPDNLSRIVPQIYGEADYYDLISHYTVGEIIFTIYKTSMTEEQVIEFIRDKPEIGILTVPAERFSLELAKTAESFGKCVFVHTINDAARVERLKRDGACGVYTDYL